MGWEWLVVLAVAFVALRWRRRRIKLWHEAQAAEAAEKARWKPEPWRAATWQGPFREDAPVRRARGSYSMRYGDNEGTVTSRDISEPIAERIGGNLYIDAFCHLRGERRTFRVDRIRALGDPAGNRIGNPEAHFAAMLPARPEDSPAFAAHVKAMARVLPSLRALIWIARSDRDVDAEEMAVLLAYVPARLALTPGSLAWDEHLARAWIDDANPVKADAAKALGEMKRGSPQAALFRDFAWRLVTTGGEPDRLKAGRHAQLVKMLD